MKGSEILAHVDHTLLKPTATWEQIKELCQEAISCKTASVCIPASYVAPVHKEFGDKLNICTVIGFPLGYDSKEAKITAAEQAIKDGAKEVDMVINITDAKNGSFEKITEEIAEIKKAVESAFGVKVVNVNTLNTKSKKVTC